MLEELIDRVREAVKLWRSRALQNPRLRISASPNLSLFTSYRPFFQELDRYDSLYVANHRAIVYGSKRCGPSTRSLTLRASGYELGKHMVMSREVKSLDDIPKAFALHRIGLVDIVRESMDRMEIRIYECLSCSGVPNLGENLCHFEAGVLQGVLEFLVGKNVVVEKQCWGQGYNYCLFEVTFM